MPEPWYPAATRRNGAHAAYQAGRNSVAVCKCHYTVGRDSTSIGMQGYFTWLVSRDGTVQQFAPVDALVLDAGEWNPYGPGIEIEYLDEEAIFTKAQRAATGPLLAWLASEWGLIPTYYDDETARITPAQLTTGFISHRSLIQSEEHHDYWPVADWDAMVNPTPPPVEEPMFTLILSLLDSAGADTGRKGYVVGGMPMKVQKPLLDGNGAPIATTLYSSMPEADWNAYWASGGGSGGSVVLTGTVDLSGQVQ